MGIATFVATIDSEMNYGAPTYNYGAVGNVIVGAIYAGGGKSGLFNSIGNFDVSVLTGATLLAAKLVHQVIERQGGNPAKVLRCTRPATWTELGVTWDKYDGTNNWTAGGGDVDETTPTPVAFNIPASTGVFEILGLLAFVTDALANRSGIVSVIYRSDNQAPGTSQYMSFKSSENTPEADRWRLVVEYASGDLGRRREGGDVGTGRERRPRAPLQPSAPRQARRPRSWWAGR